MDLSTYFEQTEHYFSESEGQLVRLDSMPFPRLFYSFHKLAREFGDEFHQTPLYHEMWARLHPSPKVIQGQLQKFGEVAHVGTDRRIRNKLYSAAKKADIKITTHADSKGWVTAKRTTPIVTVRGH